MKNYQKQDKKWKVGRVEEKDSERVWEIRNHPLVREKSGNPEIIPLENHKKWFCQKYFGDKKNFCYVLGDDKGAVGYCRFDHDEQRNLFVVSIAVDPNHHSKGLGSRLLLQSLEKLKEKSKTGVFAEVKKGNPASARLFEKTGFEKTDEDEENFYFIKK